MLNTPFSPWPSFTHEEADAISAVLLSNKVNYWTGTECRDFEAEFAKWTGTEYAIALANGTVALEVALKALGVSEGDEVVVTSRTFLASASSIVTVGAVPVFADVDPDSQNITAESIQAVLSKKTKAIICVQLAGWPCEMDSIMALANKNDLFVVEDCAQAHGAKYKSRSVGSIGHIGTWSFCQDKVMTTGGEGGMVTTNDRDLWSKMWSYKDHGKSWEAVYNREHPPGFRWLHDSFGTNWRMTEMQAAIGRIQLKRMADWTEKRQLNAKMIWAGGCQFDALRVPEVPDYIEHAAYKCYLFVRPEKLKTGWDRDRIMNNIIELGVPCFSGSCSEVYLEKAFDNTGWRPIERLPVAKELGETSLMFLVHPTLTHDEIAKTIRVLQQVMVLASK
ncbi:MAG: DegT/DnrJ/EryC1/StrS aminotransferase family protein [Gammaproteobacteria bacterium]|nr:DegT/DnrJ/EryC1/StrS aminotransferase family protein [Gammaproteobacteria bacterium]